MFYTTNLPHGPQIVDDLRDLKDRKDMDLRSREWGAMVKRLDISVGKLIQKLKEEGTASQKFKNENFDLITWFIVSK